MVGIKSIPGTKLKPNLMDYLYYKLRTLTYSNNYHEFNYFLKLTTKTYSFQIFLLLFNFLTLFYLFLHLKISFINILSHLNKWP